LISEQKGRREKEPITIKGGNFGEEKERGASSKKKKGEDG